MRSELMEAAERLSSSATPNHTISALLTKAAEHIKELEDQIEDLSDNSIVLLDSQGEEIAVIDSEMAQEIIPVAVGRYIEDILMKEIEKETSYEDS